MEKETVTVISTRIIMRAEAEFRGAHSNKAIAHSFIVIDGKETLIWLVGREIAMSTIPSRDILGGITSNEHNLGISDIFRGGGQVISRDSPFGGFLIENRFGKHKFEKHGGGKSLIHVFSFSQYVPIEDNSGADAINGSILLIEEETKFSSLRNLLLEINTLEKEVKELKDDFKNKTEAESENERIKVSELEAEIVRKKEGVKRYINTNVELRYLPILSSEQNKIKRSAVLFGSLIINGGPGTGKTTTLIQRIKYITSRELLDNEPDLKLSDADKNLLFDQRKSWIFFSPTELLKNYLKESMIKEGLEATDDKAFEWNDFLKRKIREYKLVNTETNRPFLFYNKETSYFNFSAKATPLLLSNFDQYYVLYNKAKFEKLKSILIKGKSWEQTAKEITSFINNAPKKLDYSSLIMLYFNLNDKFESSAKIISEEFKQLLDKAVSIVISNVKSDLELAKWFEEELKKAKQIRNQSDEEEDEDDELEEDNFEESAEVVQHFNFNLELSRKLKKLIRKVALRKHDENTKLTKKDKPFYEKIKLFLEESDLKEIGERALFKKYFERLTKGVEMNMLRELPTIYKKFRRIKLKESNHLTEEGKISLNLILKQKNLHLHKEELSLLLFKINSVIKEIFRNVAPLYNSSSNPFLKSYRETAKAIVAIDEATDFSGIDLACMSSFSHPRFNAVTLCGDIMQRMENSGIASWDEYKDIVKNTTQSDLLISFRQTPLLFELAKLLYIQYTKTEPNFSSAQAIDENDPKPLLFINQNREETANWIGDRIIEIHNRYSGNTPSIAIFVADESDIITYTNLISNHQQLQDLGITAIDCPHGRILGSATNIRVYSVKYIKGLEFEAVFFVDTDKIQSVQKEMIDKYLYVGLSRATYFLAITAINNLPKRLKVLMPHLIDNGNWNML